MHEQEGRMGDGGAVVAGVKAFALPFLFIMIPASPDAPLFSSLRRKMLICVVSLPQSECDAQKDEGGSGGGGGICCRGRGTAASAGGRKGFHHSRSSRSHEAACRCRQFT